MTQMKIVLLAVYRSVGGTTRGRSRNIQEIHVFKTLLSFHQSHDACVVKAVLASREEALA